MSLLVAALVLIGGCAGAAIDTTSTTGSSLATTTLPESSTTEPLEASPSTTVASADPVVPIRFITPDEWATTLATCIQGSGYAVTITPDGGLSFPDQTEQQSKAMEAAIDLCLELYPVDPIYQQPFTRDQLELLYDWYVTESVPCLMDLGYSGFDPPSLDTFIDSYDTGPWNPYRDLRTALDQLRESDWYALQDACPQSPPLDLLFAG